MDIGVEISLYPLRSEYIPPIEDFIERLNAAGNFRIITNSMSTQVFGEYDAILAVLQAEMRRSFEQDGKCVFVMKVLGPLHGA
jgi:uncharacterized protein YqgV (UPF0045/DUF77 family)